VGPGADCFGGWVRGREEWHQLKEEFYYFFLVVVMQMSVLARTDTCMPHIRPADKPKTTL
jgi:hypothetical protein